jgi:hypothetical protein
MAMRLDDLCATFDRLSFPAQGEKTHPERTTVLAARAQVAAAVADDAFLSDCIAQELQRLQNRPAMLGLDPFLVIPDLGIRFAFGYWPPGGSVRPHEHTAWTITAICRNRLDVVIYDRPASYRQKALVPAHSVEAGAGRTGFIYDPCIHQPRNTSCDWSLSLHVTSPRDGEDLDRCDPALPWVRMQPEPTPTASRHPYAAVITARHRQRSVHQLVRVLCSMAVPTAREALAQACALGASPTRNLVRRAVPGIADDGPAGARNILTRTHADLVMRPRHEVGRVSLDVLSSDGFREELVISDLAADAVTFLAARQAFDISELPGNLSPDERAAIAHAVEQAGLFRSVWQ